MLKRPSNYLGLSCKGGLRCTSSCKYKNYLAISEIRGNKINQPQDSYLSDLVTECP